MIDLKLRQSMDQEDPLGPFRSQFYHNKQELYFDGNSLGKLPLKTKEIINGVIQDQWGNNLIRSWNDHWLDLPKRLAAKLSLLLNVNAKEVLVGESTSVNLYKVALALIQS